MAHHRPDLHCFARATARTANKELLMWTFFSAAFSPCSAGQSE
jgi:hypothetical protein